jgi:inhibitor of cysteine peptidase
MKSKLILIGVVAVISILLLACSPAAKQASVEVPLDDFTSQNHISREVTVNAGDSFTLTLGSNPTTGFTWPDEAQIGDQTVLQQTDHKLVVPESEPPPPPGTPGKELWTFKALKKGTTEVSMEYSRPWEGGEKGVWTFSLTVVVK